MGSAVYQPAMVPIESGATVERTRDECRWQALVS